MLLKSALLFSLLRLSFLITCCCSDVLMHIALLCFSSLVLDRDERANVLSADRACVSSLDKAFAAIATHAEMAAWHDECIFVLAEADQALSILVVFTARRDLGLAILWGGVLFIEAVD